MEKSFSVQDMKCWLPSSRVGVYSDFASFPDIDSALGSDGSCVFLYLTSRMYGHWVAVFRRGNTIEVFDSLGFVPDDELQFVPLRLRKRLGENQPYLSRLLDASPYTIHYNDWKLQKDSPAIATCGRHCIVRLAFREMGADSYAQMLLKSGNPDKLVVEAMKQNVGRE